MAEVLDGYRLACLGPAIFAKERRELAAQQPAVAEELDIVFDGPPGPEAGRFVEVEVEGRSVSAGQWFQREDGYWVLRIPSTCGAREG